MYGVTPGDKVAERTAVLLIVAIAALAGAYPPGVRCSSIRWWRFVRISWSPWTEPRRNASSDALNYGLRLAWLTDIHLNHVPAIQRESFYTNLAAQEPDAVLISGDIGNADTVGAFLSEIENALQKPIYFVLGNHDSYGGSIAGTRAAVSRHAAASRYLRWLPDAGVISLSATTALVGHDGWGDGRAGDFFTAEVMMSDFQHIRELQCRAKQTLLGRLNALGDEAAAVIGDRTVEALTSFQNVIVLTHVPPFKDPAWAGGRISNDALPFYVCKAVGERLIEIAGAHPERSLTVLCGHVHTAGVSEVLPNLIIRTGAARYGKPVVQRILEI